MEALLNKIMLASSVILLMSIFLSKTSNKFGLPILIIFLFMGMLAGSEGIGGIYYDNYELTHSLSLIAMCLIIFSGGLETKWEDVQRNFRFGSLLSTFGVVITGGLVAASLHFFFGMGFVESCLLGAILSSTDTAAVFMLFRDKKYRIQKDLRSILEFESGSNDPMALFLVSIILAYYDGEISTSGHVLKGLLLNISIGLAGGILISKVFTWVNNVINLEHKGLYPALTLAFLFLTYSSTTMLEGNGFLAVYLFGVFVSKQRVVHKKSLFYFYDGVSWLSQIGLFILLGLLVFPSKLLVIAPKAVFIASFMMVVARPFAVFLMLTKSNFNFKQKIFISWAGLKGATPIVFASFAATHIGQQAYALFDIVFFAVLISTIIQGGSLRWLAKKLNLTIDDHDEEEFPIDLELVEKTKNGVAKYHIRSQDFAVEKRIIDLNLPSKTLVLFIKRQGQFIIPDGSTVLYAHDHIMLVTQEKWEVSEAITCMQVEKIIEPEVDISGSEEQITEVHSDDSDSNNQAA